MSESFEHQQNPYSWESDIPNTSPKKEKKGWTAGKIVAIALVCSLLGGAAGSAATLLLDMELDKEHPQQSQETPGSSNTLEGLRANSVLDVTKIDTGKVMTAAEVYAVNVNSTVGITTSITTNFWGYQTTSAAAGSGFIFSDDGYILTNFHVVEDSSSITVALFNGKTYDAKLIGYDEGNDVAVLKIDATGLVPVVLGNSDNINVGDSVLAIGNPLGELTFSLTAGTISAKDRDITMSGGSTMRLMQTDCAINSGNSGGALFNMYGEVVGITTAKYSGNSDSGATIEGLGFAIPTDDITGILEDLKEFGYVTGAYIGVMVRDVDASAQSYGLPAGAYVEEVTKGYAAEKAGIRTGDIIINLGGYDIDSLTTLTRVLRRFDPGQTVSVTVYRNGQHRNPKLWSASGRCCKGSR